MANEKIKGAVKVVTAIAGFFAAATLGKKGMQNLKNANGNKKA